MSKNASHVHGRAGPGEISCERQALRAKQVQGRGAERRCRGKFRSVKKRKTYVNIPISDVSSSQLLFHSSHLSASFAQQLPQPWIHASRQRQAPSPQPSPCLQKSQKP
ncbi:hypothetical protein KC19_1G248900 [Ceratodon purpureus]|uniref:Uncharacterized protein n=1 Tax=Ceratodon purpureus TaxID=3225 RepID=A0A8T0J9I5_CERPU|nr:hypothetical protein KC19_1G248900 [Ceratodon purpureus]